MLSSHAAAFLASSANVESSAAAASSSSSSSAPASNSTPSAASAAASAPAAPAAPAKPAAGVVLFSACCDWDCSTRPDAIGLDGPHRVAMPCPIASAFSSSSAAHVFLLSLATEPHGQRLFACGRNERGQLGTGAVTAKAAQTPVEVQRFAPAGETIVKVCFSSYSIYQW